MAPIDRRNAVARMLAALAHRGPDSEGTHEHGAATLGHRRLSIFDLSDAGRQPMSTPDGAISVVFNGAVYNWRALRAELEAAGTSFRSQTDTEVLLHGYLAWGIDRLVARLRGMFAIGLWDARRETLYLVRDRLGVKPLVYAERGATLAFASTPRALRAAGVASEIDAQAVAGFLEYGYVPESSSIYAGVRKLPPATIGEWKDGRLALRSYWSSPALGSAGSVPFEDAVEETERLLLRAVEQRLHADVPVGALLSGGIDSGLVCWAIAKLGGRVTAFTVGTPGNALDETDDAVATARELGIDHEVLALSDSDAADVAALVSAYAEPFAVESALGMLRVSAAVRNASVRVLLTGDGGDDVFLGYERHRHLMLTQRLARLVPGVATPAWRLLRGLAPHRGRIGRAVHLGDYVTGGLPAYLDAHDGLPYYHRHGILGERLADATVPERGRRWNVRSARNILAEYLEHDLDHQFVAEYLTKVDGATMWHALEARSPFFDQELWEYAASLPAATKLHGGELKAVLRELARRRIGPRVAGLRKRGFAVPVRDWFARGWRRTMIETFTDSQLAEQGWADTERALAQLRAVPEGGHIPNQLWYLFVLEHWLRADRRIDAGAARHERMAAVV